jgi:hypothetical protein
LKDTQAAKLDGEGDSAVGMGLVSPVARILPQSSAARRPVVSKGVQGCPSGGIAAGVVPQGLLQALSKDT